VPKVIAWKAWYSDGKVYRSESLDWSDLPDDGVVAINLYYDKLTPAGDAYRRFMQGSDYYFRVIQEDGSIIYGQSSLHVLPKGKIVANGKTGGKKKLPKGAVISESRESIVERYPSAEIKMGKWVSDKEIDRIVVEAGERQPDDPRPTC